MPVINKIATLSRLATRSDFYHLLAHRPGDSDAVEDNIAHANAAVDWLLKANAVCVGRGFSKAYSIRDGWFGPYAETTGYIVATLYEFLKASAHRGDEVRSAIRSSIHFLIETQFPDGAFGDSWSSDPLVYTTTGPMVFDTGQVIFGLLACHRAGDDDRSLGCAIRAGDWLLKVQEDDGSWRQFTFSGRARTYYSRSAHSLAELWKETGDERYREGALKQLRWVLRQQLNNGAFRHCSFETDDLMVLHVIAYTLDGLWKAGEVLGEKELQDASRRGATALARIQAERGILAGHYDQAWNSTDSAKCLTGLAQMAEVWQLIYEADRDPALLGAAHAAIEYLKRRQIRDRSRENMYGGLPGSYPWSGRYFPWAIPNWAQKFFIDALILRERIRANEA